jgi:hypothetical protein
MVDISMLIQDIFGGLLSCSDHLVSFKSLKTPRFFSFRNTPRHWHSLCVDIRSMQQPFHSKRILKPDVPPPTDNGFFEKLGHGFVVGAIGFCCAVSAVALVLLMS